MDRMFFYSGEVPRTVDVLQAEQNTMVALGKLAGGIIGNGVAGAVRGLTLVPTIPASLNLTLNAGEVYQTTALEATTYSALPADTSDAVTKQGIALEPQTLTITPPGTSGFSQVFLVEVQYQDSDTNPVVLPYFNAANPSSPFSGPGNSGTAQNTFRRGLVNVVVKAGTAATTGTQIAPTVDSGFIGLWLITVANGATTIVSGNIVMVTGAQFIGGSSIPTLLQIPSYIQSGAWGAVQDTGSVNALVVAPSPAPTAIAFGTKLTVKAANAVTGASTIQVTLVSGTQTNSIIHGDGSALLANDIVAGQFVELNFDGANWQMPRASASVAASQLTASAVGANAPINALIATSVSAGALSVQIEGSNGAAISTSNPLIVTFNESGVPVTRIVTSSPGFVLSSGSTMGFTSGVAGRLWVVLIDNSGTVLLGLMNANGQTQIFPLFEDAAQNTGAGTGGGNSAGVIYTSVASLSGKPIKIIGYLEWTTALGTAGVWSAVPNRTILSGPGTKKPGDTLGGAMSASYTPQSAANLLKVHASVVATLSSGASDTVVLKRNASVTLYSAALNGATGTTGSTVSVQVYDNPAAVASTAYAWTVSGGGSPGLASTSILIEEIMA